MKGGCDVVRYLEIMAGCSRIVRYIAILSRRATAVRDGIDLRPPFFMANDNINVNARVTNSTQSKCKRSQSCVYESANRRFPRTSKRCSILPGRYTRRGEKSWQANGRKQMPVMAGMFLVNWLANSNLFVTEEKKKREMKKETHSLLSQGELSQGRGKYHRIEDLKMVARSKFILMEHKIFGERKRRKKRIKYINIFYSSFIAITV